VDFIYEERILWILQYKVELILNDPKKIKKCDKKRLRELMKKIHKLKRLLFFTYQHQINLMVDKREIWSAFELCQFQAFQSRLARLEKYFSQIDSHKGQRNRIALN